METVYLMSEVESNFFAEPLLCPWWLYFQENIFILGPKSVSICSCSTTTGFSFVNFVLLFLLKDVLLADLFYK